MNVAELTDEQIRERLEAAGMYGVTDTELVAMRTDKTLLHDIEKYDLAKPFGFGLANFPSKDARSNEEKFRDILPKSYGYGEPSKKTDAQRKKRLAAKAARKQSRKKR